MEVRIGLVAPYEGMMAIANELAKRRGVGLLARTELVGQAYQGFRAAGVAVPPRVGEL